MDNISSKKLCKFVVEIPKRNQEAKYDMWISNSKTTKQKFKNKIEFKVEIP
jgi:hypothetical protein